MEEALNEDIGRIPREALRDQDERLTNKHIQTLTFLKDIAKENKRLKASVTELEEKLEQSDDFQEFAKESKEKIEEVQAAYMKRADEMIQMLTEKHRVELMAAQEEKFELEKELKEQILRMRHEMDALQAANKDLRDTAAEDEENNEAKTKLKEIMKHNASVRKENEELRDEVESLQSDLEMLQSKKAADMNLIRDLRTENKRLEQDLQEVQQKNNELEYRLDKTIGELEEKKKDQDKSILIENLRDKLQQLSQEREAWLEKELQMKQDMFDLNELKDDIKDANLHLQSQLQNLINEYGFLSSEFEKLQKASQKDRDKKTFQDFVKLKRQLNTLKDENSELKSKSKHDRPPLLRAETPPQPAPKPKKKNSLEGTRDGAKKILAITAGPNK